MSRLVMIAALAMVLFQTSPHVRSPQASASERFEYAETLMGMQFKVIVYAPDEQIANRAVQGAFKRIQFLNTVCSDYEADSELNTFCAQAGGGQKVQLSDDLFAVLESAQKLSEKTDGAFDCTVGPLTRLWRRSRRSKTLPAPQVLAGARQLVGYRQLTLNAKGKTGGLEQPKMQLDLGGIAVGYAIDEALSTLRKEGIKSALIDGSGDIGVSDAPPGTSGWRIGVAPLEADKKPSRYVILANAAVTTSGDAYQFVEIDGIRYSHIVDPRTGLGLTRRISATVISRTCIVADSYATAVCVLGPEKGLELIKKTPESESLIIVGMEETIKTYESSGFSRFEKSEISD